MYVVLTKDLIYPSEDLKGLAVKNAVIVKSSVILARIFIKRYLLLVAGAVVTRDVQEFKVIDGNLGKVIL